MITLKYRIFDGHNRKEIEMFLGAMAQVGDITGEGEERYLPIFHINDWNIIKGKKFVKLKKDYYVIKIENTWAVVASFNEICQDRLNLKTEAVEKEIRRRGSIDRLRNQHVLFEWNS